MIETEGALANQNRRGPAGLMSAWVDAHAGTVAPRVGIVASFVSP